MTLATHHTRKHAINIHTRTHHTNNNNNIQSNIIDNIQYLRRGNRKESQFSSFRFFLFRSFFFHGSKFFVDWIGMFVCLLSQLKSSHKTICRFANEQPSSTHTFKSARMLAYAHTHTCYMFVFVTLNSVWAEMGMMIMMPMSVIHKSYTHIFGLVKMVLTKRMWYSEYVRFQTQRKWLTYLFKAVNSPADDCRQIGYYAANSNSLNGNILHV